MATEAPTLPNPVLPVNDVSPAPGLERGTVSGLLDKIAKTSKVKDKITPAEPKLNPNDPPKDIPFTDKGKKPEVETPKEEVAKVEDDNAPEQVEGLEGEGPKEKEDRAWGKTKRERDQYRKEAEELRVKVADVEKYTKEAAEYKAQLEEARREREALDGEFYISRLEATKEFKQFVSTPKEDIKDQSDFVANRNKIDPNVLYSALEKDAHGDTTALEEILGELSEREKSRIYSLSDNLIEVNKREKDIRANSKSAYEAAVKHENERVEAQIQKITQEREGAIKTILPKLEEEIIKNMPEENRPDLAQLKKEVLTMDAWPEKLKVYGGVAAAVLPYLVDSNKALQAELKELKATNSKLRGVSPKSDGGKAPAAPAEAEKPTSYKGVKQDDFVRGLVSKLGF